RGTDQPFFLFAHFFDAHDPYVSPEPYHSQFDPDYTGPIDGMRVTSPDSPVRADMDPRDLHNLIARYDGGIRYVDDQVGQLLDKLDALGLADNTLVIVTSDHGEEFFEHGHKTHRRQLHAESIEVPLILRWPAQLPAGRVVAGSAGIVDITPTMLAAAGTGLGHACAGQNLLPSAKGAQLERHDYLSELLLFDEGPSPLRQFAWHDQRANITLGQTSGSAPWQWQDYEGSPIPMESPEVRSLIPRWDALLTGYRALGAAIPYRSLSATPLTPSELAELAAMGYSGGDDDGLTTTKPTRRLSIEGGPWPD
ncbi:MAG: hypothetical protein ACI8QC_002977, partial [Planctomycetota bacterium]